MPANLSGAPVAFVDVETTGGHAQRHRITEVGVVTARNGVLEESWSTLVNPGVRIPPGIEALTGISNEMVSAAPPFAAVANELRARLAGRLFVAHNVRFDYGFIRSEMRRAGAAFAARTACTVQLSRRLYPHQARHNLDAVIAAHGIECASRHRALPDARVLFELWRQWRDRWPREQLDAAIEAVARSQMLPPRFSVGLLDDLPESTGVYLFHDSDDALIYVGKAKNIRARVLAHFAGALRDSRSQRLAGQTQRIEWTETAGELGALLLEARLVKELRPVYNRRPRGGESLTWMIDDLGGAPRMVDLAAQSLGNEDAFGLYRSERAARSALTKLAREARLCLKALGLEAGGGSCLGFQIGRCSGVCVGIEPVVRHQARVKMALIRLRLKPWPWDGPVGIPEGSDAGLHQVHVVDRWQYLGSFADAESLPSPLRPPTAFDADSYRLLTRYLSAGCPRLQRLTAGQSGARRPTDIFEANDTRVVSCDDD